MAPDEPGVVVVGPRTATALAQRAVLRESGDEPLMPSQLPHVRLDAPERDLWLAVLSLALADATNGPLMGGRPTTARGAAAWRWLQSDELHIGSLRWVTDVLDINVRRLRAAVARRVAAGSPVHVPRRVRHPIRGAR